MRTCTPDLCCQIRKIEPLQRALTRLRRLDDRASAGADPQRATTKIAAWEERYGAAKIAPLPAWTDEQVWDYVKAHDVPVNPLLHQGTRASAASRRPGPCHDDEDPRAGRWSGMDKTECGLHWVGANGGSPNS
jgi:3'-phosphoadenosine 5'-phosphosulfate sulfotransferase (PAPS reductase)/FAD synthetase